jgi:hypothetical protein
MYYSGNRYLSLDEMKVNAQYIRDYLTTVGWTVNSIAGILGNMQTESNINPAIWENFDSGNLSRGFGLVQWTPATKYLDWCTTMNLAPAEMDSNLQRILYEVNQGLQWGNDSEGNHPPYSFYQFTQSTEPPYTLGMNFLWYYERPLVKNQPVRGEQANFWYEYLTGTTPPDNPPIKPVITHTKCKSYMYIKKRRYIIK